VREGHAVGNHTYSHARCRELDLDSLLRELERTDAAIQDALGAPPGTPAVFRPPFGELRVGQALRLAGDGRRIAFWSRDTRDYRGATAAEIAALGGTVGDGDIILMHDRFPATVEALPELLRVLPQRGLVSAPLASPADPTPGRVIHAARAASTR
ncbi:MAG: putative polysaccharide deacetylase, partial [Armatimonadetes bacterium]|nr:putative polysaccharide deacetylase [Armatimonadota bacterium]